MPKHNYTVKVGEDTYDVSSDHELSDVEAYQLALGQAAPDSSLARTSDQSSKGGLLLAGAKAAAPAATKAVAEFGASPTAAATAGAIVRHGTTLGGIAHGVATLNPAEVIAAPRAGWAAGRGGYWLGKGAQVVARPVAAAMEAAAPYVATLGTMSGLQGGLDLAQMADPKREDIGFLGIGGSKSSSAQLAARLEVKLKELMAAGMSKPQALQALNEIVKASR